MIKFFRYLSVAATLLAGFSAKAQTTTSSPYSAYGLGNLTGTYLPQFRSMGNLSTGIRQTGTYYNINPLNPASYASIHLTAMDVGVAGKFTGLAKGSASEKGFNGSLSHFVFAIPVSSKSALSFGILPYSELGYDLKTTDIINGNSINYMYSGEGGLSKAYLGYGFQLGHHISFGANASYLFGKLINNSSAEFPNDPSAISSQVQNNKSLSGLSYDYGFQYFAKIGKSTEFTVGYSGSSSTKINSSANTNITRYIGSADDNLAIDTVFYHDAAKSKVTLPLIHNVGFSFDKPGHWLVGADFSYGKWSQYREGNTDLGLEDRMGVSVGGQVTPDITAVSNYFKLVDYRLGFRYDKSYISINDNDIKEYALNFGFGFPLPSNQTSFYKINLGVEIGQRGTLQNNLVRERFTNVYLGFTLNDKWFRRYKFD